MYPWLWFWAPHFEFPLSGNVTQDIEPIIGLFNGVHDPQAGDPQIEQKAFRKASYGRQLGLISEVLVAVAERTLPDKGKNNRSLQDLKDIQSAIEEIKDKEYDAELHRIERRIAAIRKRGGRRAQALERMLKQPEGGSS